MNLCNSETSVTGADTLSGDAGTAENPHGRTQRILIATVAGVSVAFLLFYGLYAFTGVQHFTAVNESWVTHNRNTAVVTEALSKIRSSVGYGGFIHNFKNFVLRRDPALLGEIRENHAEFNRQMAVLRDILPGTEEQQALDALQTTIDDYVRKINSATQNLMNMSPQELDRVVRVDDSKAIAAFEFLTARSKQESEQQEDINRAKIGNASYIYNFGALIIALIVLGSVLLFINQRRLNVMRTSLADALDEATRANDAKNEFLSLMSHELRTPLNAVIGFSQLLEIDPDDPLPENKREYASYIRKSGLHLLALIDDVLDLSKIEAGGTTVSIEDVDLKECVDSCLALITPMIDRRDITLTVRGDGLDGAVLRADSTRLKQVILNLLGNAVKYGGNSGNIAVSYESVTPGYGRVCVSDTGPGIPVDRQHELFQPFSRLGAQNSAIDGTGIGLFVSNKLIDLMGGTMGFDSTPGEGSAFWLELSISENPRRAGDIDPALEEMPASTDRLIGTVLYIEDNPANALLMEEIVKRIDGLKLISTHTAEIGIELARERTPDIIILDIDLPDMNGYTALGQIRATTEISDIPVIALTAAAHEKDIRRGLDAGFKHYLVKPVDIARLIDILEKEIPATVDR
tara:strand:- start:1204 stop:3099 length:1896 start_codon:yes stop_codon:yes gene_type:complete